LTKMLHSKGEHTDDIHRWNLRPQIQALRSNEIQRLIGKKVHLTLRAKQKDTLLTERQLLKSSHTEKMSGFGLIRQTAFTGIIAVLTAKAVADLLWIMSDGSNYGTAGGASHSARKLLKDFTHSLSDGLEEAGGGISGVLYEAASAVLSAITSLASFILSHTGIVSTGHQSQDLLSTLVGSMERSILVLGFLAVPLLLWMRFLSSARSSAGAVVDIRGNSRLASLLLEGGPSAEFTTSDSTASRTTSLLRRGRGDEDIGGEGEVEDDEDDDLSVSATGVRGERGRERGGGQRWWEDEAVGDSSGRWSIDGPDKAAGIRLQGVSAVTNGREVLKVTLFTSIIFTSKLTALIRYSSLNRFRSLRHQLNPL
jgi:hypothetical protein